MRKIHGILIILFFAYRCFSQEQTFINCNSIIKIRFDEVKNDSFWLVLSFQNTSGKPIYLSNIIKTRWTENKEYLGISLGDNFSNEPPNYNYELIRLPKGEIKKFQVIIEKSRVDFFYVQLRGSFFVLDTQMTKKQYSYFELPIKNKRLIYYDFEENFYEYGNRTAMSD